MAYKIIITALFYEPVFLLELKGPPTKSMLLSSKITKKYLMSPSLQLLQKGLISNLIAKGQSCPTSGNEIFRALVLIRESRVPVPAPFAKVVQRPVGAFSGVFRNKSFSKLIVLFIRGSGESVIKACCRIVVFLPWLLQTQTFSFLGRWPGQTFTVSVLSKIFRSHELVHPEAKSTRNRMDFNIL